MDSRMTKVINEIGFNQKEIDLINKVYGLDKVPQDAFIEMFVYFTKESYRKGTLNGINEVNQVVNKSLGRGFL